MSDVKEVYQEIPVDDLVSFSIRGIRPQVVEQLKARISKGYNPARPLSVIRDNGHYAVVDGNHRLMALKELGEKTTDKIKVPCLVRTGDPYRIAVECNQDEDTYAPIDLFDWLDIIAKLKEAGLTQVEIGEKIGWSRSGVLNYNTLLEKIDTQVIKITREHQAGRVSFNDTSVSFNFTEGWFRSSGLYELEEKYQEGLLNDFISDKFNWNKNKVQSESSKYKRWQDYIQIAKDKLVNADDLAAATELIENDTFRNKGQLLQKIDDFNHKSQNKLICGDALVELAKLPDASIDLVITDPPYGIDYESNYSIYNDYITKSGVVNDELKNALTLLNKTLAILVNKTKSDALFYIFTSWKVYPLFAEIISKYFSIKNLLIWDKGNWSMGDLNSSWGNQYEMIVFATKGKRNIKRRGDIITVARVPTTSAIHPTQKPVELITELLKVSAQKADTVCDPFMGSGSTIKAVKQYDGLNYIGIEIDKAIFEKAKATIGVV